MIFKNFKKFIYFFCFLSLFIFGKLAIAEPLSIELKGEAIVARAIVLEVVGEVLSDDSAALEWAFSENVKSLSIKDRGRSCSFTMFGVGPIAISVKAYSSKQEFLSETHLLLNVRPADVNIIPLTKKNISLWNPVLKREEEVRGIAINSKFSFEVTVSPDFGQKVQYQWDASQGCSFDVSDEGNIITFWRSETGLCVFDVTVFNEDGVILGKGVTSADVSISQADINRSNRQKKAWGNLESANKIWNEASLVSADGFDKAMALIKESKELDPETPEIFSAFVDMEKGLEAIIRAKKFASEGDELRGRQKWTECLKSYRASFAAWPFSEVGAKISEVEKIVLEIRLNRDRAAWLRDMAKAYEAEQKYREAIDCFQKSLELDKQGEAVNGIKKLEETIKKHEEEIERKKISLTKNNQPIDDQNPQRAAEAERLKNDGHNLYRAGKYEEALICYKKSLEIKKDTELEKWLPRVESGIKAQKSIDEANRLIKEGNAFYAVRRFSEALKNYKASVELYPNEEVNSYIRHIEEIMLKSDK